MAPPRFPVWAGAAITDELDRTLLVRWVDSGAWDLPGGYLQAGEDPVSGLRRVVSTAAGALISVVALVGIHSRVREGLSLIFIAQQIGGVVTAGIGVEHVRWVPTSGALRVMWPRRAEQLHGVLENESPAQVVVPVPVGQGRPDLSRAAGLWTAISSDRVQ